MSRLYTASFDFAQPCVFVKQLPGPILCASHSCEDPLFRSYGVNLPSSLTMNLPSALVYSTRLRVSVCGTGILWVKLSGFSREYAYLHYCIVRRRCILSTFSSEGGFACPRQAPTIFNGLFRQPAEVSLLRLHIAPKDSNGILTVSAIGLSIRMSLRSRLTRGRLTLPRKP